MTRPRCVMSAGVVDGTTCMSVNDACISLAMPMACGKAAREASEKSVGISTFFQVMVGVRLPILFLCSSGLSLFGAEMAVAFHTASNDRLVCPGRFVEVLVGGSVQQTVDVLLVVGQISHV